MICRTCGTELADSTNGKQAEAGEFCPKCGTPIPRPVETIRRSGAITAAAVLSIAGGSLIVVLGLLSIFAGFILGTVSNAYDAGFFTALVVGLGTLYTACGAFIVVSGVFILNRQYWRLALAGSILHVLVSGFSAIGIASLVLVIISRNDFRSPRPVPTRG